MSTQTIGPIPVVGYTPDPATAALKIAEGGQTYGPYPATVTLLSGVPQLTVTTTDPIVAEAAMIQPGSWPAPQTDPTAFSPIGSPLPGNLNGVQTLAAGSEWDVSVDGPYVNLAEESAVLEAEASQPVFLRWHAADSLLGSLVTLAGNSAVLAVEMAITHGPPQPSDWQPAALITRAVGDSTDGEYSLLTAGPEGALSLTAGLWHVFGRVTTASEVIVVKAPGVLNVQN